LELEVMEVCWTSTACMFIAKAVAEAYRAVECGGGNPFGAVVARGDEDVVSSHNSVRSASTPIRRRTLN
jgi:tRNA(Arg) A34 adenosine deaminase TadA